MRHEHVWSLPAHDCKTGLALCYRTAVTVADQQQDSEVTALRTVITLANETLFDLINATITANYTAQLNRLDTSYSSSPSDVGFLVFMGVSAASSTISQMQMQLNAASWTL